VLRSRHDLRCLSMDIKDFTDQLKLDGYAIVEREVTPNRSLNEHDHDWAVIAMVTAGDFYVHTSNLEKTYSVGEVFSLQPNEVHSEGAGALGATLLIARR
jgi:quercetin dioxygenase-like cupin family protein